RVARGGAVANPLIDLVDCGGLGPAPTSQLLDIKTVRNRNLMWNLRFFHAFHLRRGRALGQQALEVHQRPVRAFRDHLHRPIAEVASQPTEAQTRCLSPHPPAEPHALDATVHEEALRGPPAPTLGGPAPPADGTTKCRPPRSPPAPATRR